MKSKTNHTLLLLATLISASSASTAQEQRPSSSMYLQPIVRTDVSMLFDIHAEGQRFTPTWGLDQAWINEQNLRKGINHMGKENIGIGRSAFRTTAPLLNDSALQSDQIQALRRRNTMFNILSPTLPLVLTADQEAGSDPYFVTNKSADVDHWAAAINSHVHWLQQNTQHPVAGVSPFNEPDYWTTEEGATTAKHRDVARILKTQYPRFADIAIVGGNTLNNDKAAAWFNAGSNYYDWGNTHQLAGSFANYAAYYTMLKQKGKVGYNDEMHNVCEAMVGLEYGMTIGIWWGFDSRARGEFCDISRNGNRLAYAEHPANWTAASVYRHDNGAVKAFIGSSERQAATTAFQFVSTDREVYFDGYGPVRQFVMEMPGGTGYQVGQTNAERVIDITWGPDVPPAVINGTYKLVNKATRTVAAISGSDVKLQKYTGAATQQWTVKPCSPRTGGDYSFYDIESVNNANVRINVKNYSTSASADLLAWTQDGPTSNEQWYLEYDGNGYYLIRNRESALYMAAASTSTANDTRMTQLAMQTGTKRNQLLWRLLPVDVNYEISAPAQPQNLIAEANEASVHLTWDANTEADLQGYMVLRAPAGTDDWNTIARNIATCEFTDNTCRQATHYQYAVRAVDKAQNFSAASESVAATPTGSRALIARWTMENNLQDETPNMMDAVYKGTPQYVEGHTADSKALRLSNTTSTFMQLPHQIASTDELTVCMWVNLRSTNAWQRLFDFGNDTDHYLFLTPNNGTNMRFAIKNGGNEQTLDAPTKLETSLWKHVAVSIGQQKTSIFVDGEEVATTTGITIRPSDVAPVLNYVGRSQFAADPFFNGYIDDVQVYNCALDAEGVRQAMNGGVANAIDKARSDAGADSRYYSADGKALSAPRRGLNIVDGKKVIIGNK